MTAKDTDYRFTTDEVFNTINELTGVDWKKAYDPTPKNHKKDTLNIDWDATKIFLNPPFSLSHKFVPKLFEEIDKNKKIKKALIILPWYQIENVKTRVSNSPIWSKILLKNTKKKDYTITKYHLGNSKFKKPNNEISLVRVYAVYIKRK